MNGSFCRCIDEKNGLQREKGTIKAKGGKTTPHQRPTRAEQTEVMQSELPQLHQDLQAHTEELVDEIDGPTMGKGAIVDRLLDLRNLGRGRDLGLELTVDEMLESLPGERLISSEWWMTCLAELADHAAFLAAGYPAVTPEFADA
ncbi:MAG: hypothetical protein ACI81L_002017 [Verrucomicrobiales bacterium]